MTPMTEVLQAERSAAAPTGRRFYQPELDGLRFYAFLGVFIFHTIPSKPEFYGALHLPFPTLWQAVVKSGGAGVDLFFALSAYLITTLLLRELGETGGICLRHFYMRRILRIWPLYFVVLAVGVVVAHIVPREHLAWYYVAGFALFIGNWVLAVAGHCDSICVSLWTVSIEEQFYLLWPPLMKLLKPNGMIVAAAAALIASIASQACVVMTGGSIGYIHYGSFSRSSSLAVGVLLALVIDRMSVPGRAARRLLLLSGLVSWLAAAAWLLETPGPLDWRIVLGHLLVTYGAGAILLASLASRSILLRARWIVQLGKVSYGLYLIHLGAILAAVELLHASAGWYLLLAKGVALLLTIALALCSYRWLEAPFLRWKDRYATVLSRPV